MDGRFYTLRANGVADIGRLLLSISPLPEPRIELVLKNDAENLSENFSLSKHAGTVNQPFVKLRSISLSQRRFETCI